MNLSTYRAPARAPGPGKAAASKFFRAARISALAIIAALGCGGAASAQTASAYKGGVKRVVLFDYSVTNAHVESRQFIRNAVTRLAGANGFQVVMLGQQQQAQLTASVLQNTQILIFSDGDGDVLPPGDQRTAVEDFVQNQGKSALMIHAGGAYINNWQFLKDVAVQQYWNHAQDGTQGTLFSDTAGLNRPETKNIFIGIPSRQTMKDEWYSFHASARLTPGVIVLLSADEKSFTPSTSMADHAVAWTHHMGKGLALYESQGHGDIWTTNGANPNGGSMQATLWNMMRYLGHDFAGCMDNSYAEFNPDASVAKLNAADANPCVTKLAAGVRAAAPTAPAAAATLQRGGLAFVLPIAAEGRHSVRLLDAGGHQVYAIEAVGPTQIEVPIREWGIFYAEISSGKKGAKPEMRKIDLIH